MKRVLITGLPGFVGLSMLGYWLYVGENERPHIDFNLVPADRSGYKDALKHDYDYIIHLAPVDVDDVIADRVHPP